MQGSLQSCCSNVLPTSPRHPVRASPPGIRMQPTLPRVRLRALRSGVPRTQHSRGQALVELAVVSVVLLLLLATVIDFGRLFYTQITVENSARAGALVAARAPDSYTGDCPNRLGIEQDRLRDRRRVARIGRIDRRHRCLGHLRGHRRNDAGLRSATTGRNPISSLDREELRVHDAHPLDGLRQWRLDDRRERIG